MGPRLTTGSGGEMEYETDHGQRQGQGATPAAFYLGLCRLRGILSPPASDMVILQAGHSFFYATEIRIGRERSQPLRLLQAELFSFAATKI